jgi:hypothetical protein
MKKLFGLLAIFLFVLTSCEKDEDKNVDLTSDEAKALLDESMTDMKGDIISLSESEGVNAAADLVKLIEGSMVIGGRETQREWTKERLEILIQYFVDGPAARTNNTDPTSFDEIKGLYIWNPEIQDFEKEPSDYFIVQFPTEGSTSNNAELKISDLQFTTVVDRYDDFVEEYEVPSIIVGYLKVDDVVVIELDYEVSWTEDGMPKKANVSLLLKPFTFSLKFDDTFPTTASLLSTVYLNDEIIVGVDLNVDFETEAKEDVKLLTGGVQYRKLEIKGTVDPTDIPEDGDPNDFIDLALYSDGTMVGDIEFVFDETVGDYVEYVVFEDGTREPLETYLDPVFEEIEAIFAEFE